MHLPPDPPPPDQAKDPGQLRPAHAAAGQNPVFVPHGSATQWRMIVSNRSAETIFRTALERRSLCQPSGPDGEGQAGGQARNARGEPQRLSEGWTGPSQLQVKPCGHAESFAMLPSWLPKKLLMMNHFELNYKRH